jgi:hypothetical protein
VRIQGTTIAVTHARHCGSAINGINERKVLCHAVQVTPVTGGGTSSHTVAHLHCGPVRSAGNIKGFEGHSPQATPFVPACTHCGYHREGLAVLLSQVTLPGGQVAPEPVPCHGCGTASSRICAQPVV